ncbi:MAG: hypothetical protein ACFCUE_06295 [Candidatus Bathyarchaeia archaeon]|jgi:hypothetical protein
MAYSKFITPLKIGVLLVTIAYFVFNLHTVATIEWIGEWARTPGSFNTIQLIEDINATVGNAFRMAGSVIALAAISYYFAKKNYSEKRGYLTVKLVLFCEGIYWFGLLASGMSGVYRVFFWGLTSPTYSLGYVLPAVFESTIVPITILILAFKISPNKPAKNMIRWGMISGTVLVFAYWLLNTGMWASALSIKGTEYLTNYPHLMIAFLSTAAGLLALGFYSVYATKKLSETQSLEDLNLKPVGVIITGLGVWYLWNYLTYIFFGGVYIWSYWWAWLLGHNMDLWMLALPLAGLPLLFMGNRKQTDAAVKPK